MDQLSWTAHRDLQAELMLELDVITSRFGRYPLDFMHWRGSLESIQARMAPWLGEWMDGPGSQTDWTANLVAIRASDRDGMDAYFIPRCKARARLDGFHGTVGGFETLGEIICSGPEDKERLTTGEIGYEQIAALLSHVSGTL